MIDKNLTKELFKQSYNLFIKYADKDLSSPEIVKEYLSEQEKIFNELDKKDVVMDMLEVIDKLLEVGNNESKS